MALLVNLMRGMVARPCRAVLPSLHIGSTANEMTGTTVILDPQPRKRNQCVMNRQLSTSISGKHCPENLRGEGADRVRCASCISSPQLASRACCAWNTTAAAEVGTL